MAVTATIGYCNPWQVILTADNTNFHLCPQEPYTPERDLIPPYPNLYFQSF